MKIAVSSMGTSLDAWAGVPFGLCSQFIIVDSESWESVIVSVPPDEIDPSKVSLYAIRALANHGVQAVVTGQIKEICRQTMFSLGMEVIDGIERLTVREAVELYASQGAEAVRAYQPTPVKIAVASHGADLDAPLSEKDEPCTSFVIVDPQSWAFEVVEVKAGDTLEQTSVNAVRAAARSGATVVITPQIRPACCTALRALAISVALAEPGMTVRQAVEGYEQDKLHNAPYL